MTGSLRNLLLPALLLVLGAAWQGRAARAESPALPTEANVLGTLRAGHPRLLLLPEDLRRIKGLVATDATAREYHAEIVRRGEAMLTQPPVVHVLVGPRLLDQSRKALDRMETLGLLYQMDGDPRWADRARREMLAVAAFPDWNPSHFLDVAEMTHAMALGYDWFYAALSPADRQAVRQAIIEKGLERGREAYLGGKPWSWWVHDPFNWNIVCNGGLIAGALAVAEDAPDLSRFILARAVASLPRGLGSYAPDGAWAEGPGYWLYATDYAALALGALESGLGTDYGLGALPGLADAGRFHVQSIGPTRLFFNFADAGERSGDSPALFWLARRFHDPLLAWAARDEAGTRASARDLLWFDPSGSASELAHVGLDAHYTATGLAFFRSSWTDPDAIYLAFKGGDNKANHSHLDLGTFVLDAGGQRWAIDLGSDDYNLPGYFGKERYTYYRLSTAGHNTLTLGGQNQDTKAAAPLTAFGTKARGGFAVADLTAAYQPQGATRVRRGVALTGGRRAVLIEDEVAAATPADVVWAMHTRAGIALDGARATLTQGGQTLEARILAPAGATFGAEAISIPPPQHPSPGVRKLTVRLPGVTSARLVILLTPGAGPETAPPAVLPLDRWEAGLLR